MLTSISVSSFENLLLLVGFFCKGFSTLLEVSSVSVSKNEILFLRVAWAAGLPIRVDLLFSYAIRLTPVVLLFDVIESLALRGFLTEAVSLGAGVFS